MAGRLSALLGTLRPRALARMAKTVDDVSTAAQDLKRRVRQLEQRADRGEARAPLVDGELRDLREAVQALEAREARLRAIYRRDVELEPELGALGAILDAPTIRAHVERAFAAAELYMDPFPHAVVDQVFPRAFYDAVIRAIPPVECFDGAENKQRIVVPFAMAPAYSRKVWGFLLDPVVDDVLGPLLIRMFKAPLVRWIEASWPGLGAQIVESRGLQSTDGRILLRRRGYVITPHRDPKWGFVTCLLYLARDGDSEAWGTQLYSVDGDSEAEGIAPLWVHPDRCHLVKDVPFRANSALVFLNFQGAHGAHVPPDAEPAELERYIYQFRVGPTGTSIRRLLEALPPEQRGLWSGKAVDYV